MISYNNSYFVIQLPFIVLRYCKEFDDIKITLVSIKGTINILSRS